MLDEKDRASEYSQPIGILDQKGYSATILIALLEIYSS